LCRGLSVGVVYFGSCVDLVIVLLYGDPK